MTPRRKPAEPPEAHLTWANVRAWRIHRQHLKERLPHTAMLDVVSDICGLHAQVMSSAELTLWARLDGLDRDSVRRALWEERTLIKTWAMRGTLHLLRSDDFPMWQAALSTYDHYRKASWVKYFGMTVEEVEQLVAAIAEALDDRMLSREELAHEVSRATGSEAFGEKVRASWGSMLKPASFLGRLCFGPSEGQHVRFTRPDRWLPNWKSEDPGKAVLEATRRFIDAYGPVTREGVGRWWATTPAQALARIRALGEDVASVDIEGTSAWMLREHLAGPAEATTRGSVSLIPAFDQYVVMASPQSAGFMPGPFRDRIYRKAAWLSPVLLIDGRMDGVWRHDKKGKRLLVSIEPFASITARAKRAAELEAERLTAFLGGELELSWRA